MQDNPENKILDSAGDAPDNVQATPDANQTPPVITGNAGNDPFVPETQPQPAAQDTQPGYQTRYEKEDVAGQQQVQYDGDSAANVQKEWQERNKKNFEALDEKFNLDNKKLKLILYGMLGVVAVVIIAIIIILAVSSRPKEIPVEAPPPEPEIQIVKPDAVGVKKADGTLELADPGELNIGLSTPMYEPESPGLLSYFADIPCAVQLYHDLGAFNDLNKFQATASTYSALIRANLMEPLNLFHDMRYTDYQDQNHPEPEYIGTNYAILSGVDYYQTHNYELLMDSDGCQNVTYSYTFNLKNSSRIEEYDFTDYLDCLRVLTGYDLTNNDILYLIRVSMNNYNQNGQSTVQAISNDDPRDYIMFEQSPGAEAGSYNFVITCRKTMNTINAPDFSK